jgi:hypothetical protein
MMPGNASFLFTLAVVLLLSGLPSGEPQLPDIDSSGIISLRNSSAVAFLKNGHRQ